MSSLEKVFGELRPFNKFFLVQTASWDKILTSDNLRGKGLAFVDWCVMCHCCKEIADHLVLHREKAHQLWGFVLYIFCGFLGLSKNGTRYSFWLVELVGETFIRHLEFSSIVLDMVYMEEA